ncbi:MAG: aminopeptidase P family protein [Prevotellaceae bacterium]|nr:aminopeptidase P family protein [Prevotellaceae bacterium]
MSATQKKLSSLREKMKSLGIDAFVVPSNDPHFSEYTAKRWKTRSYLSGFTGSSGILAVTSHRAALWVDSRYYIQAENQLQDSGIEMIKLPSSGRERIDEAWLKEHLPAGAKVGVDGNLFSVSRYNSMKKALHPLELVCANDIFDELWLDRPALPHEAAYLLPDSITGKSRSEKLSDLTRATGGDMYIVSALDEIAWLLNMRGADVNCNPIVISYFIANYKGNHLFVASGKLNDEDCRSLQADGIYLHDYADFDGFVSAIDKSTSVKINSGKLNVRTYRMLVESGVGISEEDDQNGVLASMKAVKNAVEIEGFRRCMITDGIAMVRFAKWLSENVGKTKISETDAAGKLQEFRSAGRDYRGLSFPTIAGYKANAALPHYSAREESAAELCAEGFFLVDSGGQYLTGTTDITRTFHLGKPSSEEKEDYTLVLKGMIGLSMAKFPKNTRGSQLDFAARRFLWERGKNYLHGTGHGVGHFLNVHEGPQSIRAEENPVALLPGMVVSNEPAVYIGGKYGIRIENLLLCRHCCSSDFGDFYSFETLTLCPIETKSIDFSLMRSEEIAWLNAYHKRVYEALAPEMNEDERDFLRSRTKEISV